MLPDEPNQPELLAGCYTQGGEEAIAVYDIGLGGRPPQPEDIQTADPVIADWMNLDMVGD